MGCFSWFYSDAKHRRIQIDSPINTIMRDNKGNKWIQHGNYEGYGVFGGKDFFELLSEMNGYESCREVGIEISAGYHKNFQNNENILRPRLFYYASSKWEDFADPERDPNQGFNSDWGSDDDSDDSDDHPPWTRP